VLSCFYRAFSVPILVLNPSSFHALLRYHDGSEGIAQHFDDANRFDRPITSLRLFSDCRLSFGSQLYGFSNSEFFVPMPRGAVTILQSTALAA
jgi:hypothetical protein